MKWCGHVCGCPGGTKRAVKLFLSPVGACLVVPITNLHFGLSIRVCPSAFGVLVPPRTTPTLFGHSALHSEASDVWTRGAALDAMWLTSTLFWGRPCLLSLLAATASPVKEDRRSGPRRWFKPTAPSACSYGSLSRATGTEFREAWAVPRPLQQPISLGAARLRVQLGQPTGG